MEDYPKNMLVFEDRFASEEAWHTKYCKMAVKRITLINYSDKATKELNYHMKFRMKGYFLLTNNDCTLESPLPNSRAYPASQRPFSRAAIATMTSKSFTYPM